MDNKTDSKFIGAGVFAIFFTIMGIVSLVTKKNGYWFSFGVSGLSLAYLLYLLNNTKENKSERYDDERKEFISVKSSSVSFSILLAVMLILKFVIEQKNIVVESTSLLSILIGIAVVINLITHIFYKYKFWVKVKMLCRGQPMRPSIHIPVTIGLEIHFQLSY